MLLAVEGGRFFSSSVTGYRTCLTLLLLGKKPEEKPMRVTPWNHYQLVDQQPDLTLQLASTKNRLARGCASFLCFGRAAAGLDSPSPLKVGPTHNHHNHHDVHENSPDLEKVKEKVCNLDIVDDDDDNNINITNVCSLKSSLKRPSTTVVDDNNNNNERKVQWTDVSGGELFVIREFEPSEHSGSDDEFGNGNERSCSCMLM